MFALKLKKKQEPEKIKTNHGFFEDIFRWALFFFPFFIFILFFLNHFYDLSDVGMIMMQTGMVKQGLNSACHTYIDGTIFLYFFSEFASTENGFEFY